MLIEIQCMRLWPNIRLCCSCRHGCYLKTGFILRICYLFMYTVEQEQQSLINHVINFPQESMCSLSYRQPSLLFPLLSKRTVYFLQSDLQRMRRGSIRCHCIQVYMRHIFYYLSLSTALIMRDLWMETKNNLLICLCAVLEPAVAFALLHI